MSKKQKSRAKLINVGVAAENVTGSGYLLTYKNKKILIEFGLFQSNNKLKQYWTNNRNLNFKPREIDSILVGHNHIDHIGLIPRLYKLGCTAKIHVPEGSIPMMETMLEDTCFINVKDSEYLSKRQNKNIKPIFDSSNLAQAKKYFESAPFNKWFRINKYMEVRYLPSYHILRSAHMEIKITDGNYRKVVYYSSDLGNIAVDKPFLKPFKKASKFYDVALVESTYANNQKEMNNKMREKDIDLLTKTIIETVNERGNVIMPSFSLARTQELLWIIYHICKDNNLNVNVYIDSPLAIRVTKLFAKALDGPEKEMFEDIIYNWKKFKFIQDYSTSQAVMHTDKPKIIISASGFLVAGRILGWLENELPKQTSTVIFSGYAPPGSLADKIKGENCQVKIQNKPVDKRCKVEILKSFSSHMQYNEMLKYYGGLRCNKLYLTHGNPAANIEFATELAKKQKTYVLRKDDIITL